MYNSEYQWIQVRRVDQLEDNIVEHIPRLRRYARALVYGDTLAADDLVQDCLARALSRAHYWEQGTDLRAWLFTIMHNINVNHVRRHSNGPKFVALPEEMPTNEPSIAEKRLELRDLSQAIAKLPLEQREVLLLVSLEGLRYREVAEVLDIPEGTVMSKLSRARQKLRTVLGQAKQQDLKVVK